MLVYKSFPSDNSVANILAEADLAIGKNKGNRFRVSDTSGNVTAGGPGSGNNSNHPKRGGTSQEEVHGWLSKNGYSRAKSFNKNGDTYWEKRVTDNDEADNPSEVHHLVKVSSDGSWEHSVEGGHRGTSMEHLSRIAASGRGIKKLAASIQAKKKLGAGTDPLGGSSKKIKAGRPGSGRRAAKKRIKALGEANLSNVKINNYMNKQSA